MGRGDPTVRLRLRDEPSSTRALRQAVDRVADERNLSREDRFELKVAATEAVTNALRSAPRDHAVEVAVSGRQDAVEIEITDCGRFAPRISGERHLDAESGRGIPLMLALVDEVEFTSAGESTRVRMRKHIAAPRLGA
jgi:serine/threonine-protein kinase RsbW